MKCSNAISDDGLYVVSMVTGDFTTAEILAAALEAHALAEKYGITCQLVDCTSARNVDSVINNYDFAYGDIQTAIGRDKRWCVAILVRPDDRSHDFAETAMKNAGLSVALFRDRERAIAYLRSSGVDSPG